MREYLETRSDKWILATSCAILQALIIFRMSS